MSNTIKTPMELQSNVSVLQTNVNTLETNVQSIEAGSTSVGYANTAAHANVADVANSVTMVNVAGLNAALANKQATINASNKLAAANISGLATVATSGSYNDLSNKPEIFDPNTLQVQIGDNANASGDFTTAIGDNARATGYVSTALGSWANAFGNGSVAIGSDANASGQGSTALGSAKASGNISIAIGSGANASGQSSMALGYVANASGQSSMALGYVANASGIESTALGFGANAFGNNSISLGRYARSSGNNSTALGSGADASGKYSTALSYDANASGDHSIALGPDANASGELAMALGVWSKAYGNISIAIGDGANASGENSIAVGTMARATCSTAIALGESAQAFGEDSTALGCRANTSGNYSTAAGYSTNASGNKSTALGFCANASGENSTALGYEANTTAADAVQIGQGTNPNSGSLQFRSTVIVDGNGKIPGAIEAINPASTSATLNGLTINGTAYSIASGASYTAGKGIDISNNTISISNNGFVINNASNPDLVYTRIDSNGIGVCNNILIFDEPNFHGAYINSNCIGVADDYNEVSTYMTTTSIDVCCAGTYQHASLYSTYMQIEDSNIYSSVNVGTNQIVFSHNYEYANAAYKTIDPNLSDSSVNQTYNLPDKASGTYTLATMADVDVNKTYVDAALANKQATINASNKLAAANVSGLAAVAKSGNYDDLSNKPTIFDPDTEKVQIGQLANASGSGSVAIGSGAKASGRSSTALGIAEASGNGSTALGDCTCASGESSTALGRYAEASGNGSTAIGCEANTTAINAVQIGYGLNSNANSLQFRNTVVVDGNGKIPGAIEAINPASTSATLNGLTINGVAYGISSGGGFDPNVSTIIIGDNATAGGTNAISIGAYAQTTTDRTNNTIIIGYNAYGTIANDAVVLGTRARASGAPNSIAIGYNAGFTNTMISASYNSVAIGLGAATCANDSIAIGVNAGFHGYANFAQHNTDVAIGYHAIAGSANSIAFGTYANVASTGANCSTALGYYANVSTTNTIQLGHTQLSTLQCPVALTVTSDERDKAEIHLIDNALGFINQIEPITYVRNDRESYIENDEEIAANIVNKGYLSCNRIYDKNAHEAAEHAGSRRRAGVKAQQVQQLLKDTYGTDNYADIVCDNLIDNPSDDPNVESQLGVNYEKLIPFLIKAIQEQQAEIENQQAEIEELKSKIK